MKSKSLELESNFPDPHIVTVCVCDGPISAHFVLDSLVSMHANAHNLLLWDARIALRRSQPDPNAK